MNDPGSSNPMRDGLLMGFGILGGFIILLILLICCCCNSYTNKKSNEKNVHTKVRNNLSKSTKNGKKCNKNIVTISSNISNQVKDENNESILSIQFCQEELNTKRNGGFSQKPSEIRIKSSKDLHFNSHSCHPEVNIKSYHKQKMNQVSDLPNVKFIKQTE